MDDGRQESPGEQTLSFRAVTDEDLDEVQHDDAQDGSQAVRGGAADGRDPGQAPPARDEAPEPADRDSDEEPAERESSSDEPTARESGDEPVERESRDEAVAGDGADGPEGGWFSDEPISAGEPAAGESTDSTAEDPTAGASTAEGSTAEESTAGGSAAVGSSTAWDFTAEQSATVKSFDEPAAEEADDEPGDPEPRPEPRSEARFEARSEPAAAAGKAPELPVRGRAPREASVWEARAREARAATGAGRDEPASSGPSLFEKPAALRRPVTEEMLAALRPPQPADQPDDSGERPSLFARPASRQSPPAKKEASPAKDAKTAQAPDTRRFADEPPQSGKARAEEWPSLQDEPVAADESADQKPRDEQWPSDADEPLDQDAPAEAGVLTDPGDLDDDENTPDETPRAEQHGERDGTADKAEQKNKTDKAEQKEKAGKELPAETLESLMAALDALRESVAELRLGLDLPGSEEARQAQAELLAQLQDYVLPRVKTSAAPALIVIAGSTGAGKSTLVNSLAERNVSRTGIRRPTTGTPVLACHPDDHKWFAEGELLGGLQRLEKASPEAGMRGLVIVATEKLPQGVALLDTPDIDSVVEEHHEIAHRMLDAADLWIFVTTAARYADAPAWNLLRLAKERGARLAIVLSRVQPRSADVVLKHFVRMLTEYGLGEIDRFVIHEAKVADGRLPDNEVTDLRLWLAELSVDEDRRAQAVRETLNGVLNSFRTRVPALARHLETQVAFRAELRSDVDAAFLSALSEIDKASKNGSLLHGEVLARWQDFTGSGDLLRSLQVRRRGRSAKQAPERVLAFKAAIRAGLESVIVAAANRASEEVVARWRHRSELGGKLGENLDRPSDDLVRQANRAIASWQEHLSELVRTEGVAKRSVSKLVSFEPDSLSLIFTVAMFSGSNGEGVPHRLVNALLGAESLRGIGAKALSDLRARIGMLFDQESMRYVQALDSAGIPDESVATRLYQATYNLEVAR
ncbi:dynamin family protein [Nonomuraea sp. NPDC050643]|uniref:dynamin family protein n=1 Tax=Nonomuraea sp. NPDC050643 TaxID=3155660 RepID=UPI0033EE192B